VKIQCPSPKASNNICRTLVVCNNYFNLLKLYIQSKNASIFCHFHDTYTFQNLWLVSIIMTLYKFVCSNRKWSDISICKICNLRSCKKSSLTNTERLASAPHQLHFFCLFSSGIVLIIKASKEQSVETHLQTKQHCL